MTKEIEEDLLSYGINKQIPKVIKRNTLMALSHYPSLIKRKIIFKFKQDIRSSVMQAQPIFSTMWLPKRYRAYQINISSMFKLTHAAVPIHQIPDEIMIGWIGHELGHIMDYEQRSNLSMIRFGIAYLSSSKFVKQAEIAADTFAVNHGLADYIIATKRYILEHAGLPQAYKDKIARLYLSPEEIVAQVKMLEQVV